MKKILRSIADVMSPNDPELVEKTLARIDQQDQWNDLFSTKLIELLDGIDAFRADARTRMAGMETIKEAAEEERRQATANLVEANRRTEAAEGSLRHAEVGIQSAKRDLEEATHAYLRSKETYDRASETSRSNSRVALITMSLSWMAVILLATLQQNPLSASTGAATIVLIGIVTGIMVRRTR